MSRVRTGIRPGEWREEGGATPYVVRGYAGELVTGLPDARYGPGRGNGPVIHALCLQPMPEAKSFCGAMLGHNNNCRSLSAMERKLERGARARKRGAAA